MKQPAGSASERPTFRVATPADAASILQIYAPLVRNSHYTFEIEVPSTEDMAGRISETLRHFPWLVCQLGDQVIGYAYAGRHRARAAYQWCVETSVYVHPAHHRKGIGRALYALLLEAVRAQGYLNAYAGIALPNDASVALHESMGFRPVGVYRGVGFKLGVWHDVLWLHLDLQADRSGPPRPPRSFSALMREVGLPAALQG